MNLEALIKEEGSANLMLSYVSSGEPDKSRWLVQIGKHGKLTSVSDMTLVEARDAVEIMAYMLADEQAKAKFDSGSLQREKTHVALFSSVGRRLASFFRHFLYVLPR